MGFIIAHTYQRTPNEVHRTRETYLLILYSMVASLGSKINTGGYQCFILKRGLERLP